MAQMTLAIGTLNFWMFLALAAVLLAGNLYLVPKAWRIWSDICKADGDLHWADGIFWALQMTYSLGRSWRTDTINQIINNDHDLKSRISRFEKERHVYLAAFAMLVIGMIYLDRITD